MKLESPFFVPFFQEKCEFFDEIKDDLVNHILNKHNKNPFEVQGSYPNSKTLKQNLTEGDNKLLSSNEEYIERLKKWLMSKTVEVYDSVKIKRNKTILGDAWFHVAKKGGFHNIHAHAGVPFGGIFYVDTGNSSVGNTFINPIPGYVDKNSTQWCSSTFKNKAVEGGLIMFPGWILHSAIPHDGDRLRIIIAFNTYYN
ncbi:MAG: hypothetical protein CFH21_00326 [Alphaproteobacteria bacterium MarineAlpha5_Bin11]|nr:hypothetical protein [Pelagibacteraceae bacterium]PPR44436.1 MAG: hypothetical protein CFH21_00326 [Alphaproteobacteria bacterium MarineAlpha5_Bin11]PPR51874.1 MAG: hypothetical protein CFH20_00293 [Alphaproteobacteria bacterium MarineAlpha5_Bin10]|tara:strand:- start:748 stop:1341 length:594 start_codon:yes stop_codon:yes gene_type:complete